MHKNASGDELTHHIPGKNTEIKNEDKTATDNSVDIETENVLNVC